MRDPGYDPVHVQIGPKAQHEPPARSVALLNSLNEALEGLLEHISPQTL